MLSVLFAAAAFAPQGPGSSTAPVVINEFCYDDGGTDDREFVELYNRSANPVDISGWKLVCRDASSGSITPGGTGGDPTFIIPGGNVILPGAFFVVGHATVVPTTVPGASVSIAIVPPATTYAALMENGPGDTIELWDPANVVIDSVCFEMGGVNSTGFPLEGPGFYGDYATGDAPFGPRSTLARVADGFDTNNNTADFNGLSYPTIGFTNAIPAGLPYSDNFDAGIVGSDILGFADGFPPPSYVDPTAISSQNPSAKPASPQGGNAMSFWDVTGGGNAHSAPVGSVTDVVVDTYAWFEPTMAPVNPQTAPYTAGNPAYVVGTYNAGDGEWWCLGVRGSITGNGNPANIPGTYFADIALGVGLRYHGVSGICWAHFRTPTYSRLYLVDLRDGPSNANPTNFNIIAGPIDIVQGVNDGWQRIRLHVQGNEVVGTFGGTVGQDDGVRYHGTTTTTNAGGVYFGYREAILYNANCRPSQFDAMTIRTPNTAKTFFGTGSQNSAALTPGISADGYATIGANPFIVRGSGMAPFTLSILCVSGLPFQPGFPIPGAAPGSNAYLLTVDLSFVGFPDPVTGLVATAIPIPVDPAFVGAALGWQQVNLDPALTSPLQIAVSGGMETVIGN